MEWIKGKYKIVFNHIGYRWAVLMFGSGKFQISIDHNVQSWSIGVSFDKWLLSKQFNFSFLTVSLVIVWYKKDNGSLIYKF